jgi:hypothetical protein
MKAQFLTVIILLVLSCESGIKAEEISYEKTEFENLNEYEFEDFIFSSNFEFSEVFLTNAPDFYRPKFGLLFSDMLVGYELFNSVYMNDSDLYLEDSTIKVILGDLSFSLYSIGGSSEDERYVILQLERIFVKNFVLNLWIEKEDLAWFESNLAVSIQLD